MTKPGSPSTWSVWLLLLSFLTLPGLSPWSCLSILTLLVISFSLMFVNMLTFNLFFKNYLSMAVLGLCCCDGFSLVVPSTLHCSARASYCSGFSCCRAWAQRYAGFSSCDSWALEHRLWVVFCSMQDFSRPGIECVSPALAGRFFTTKPPRKPCADFLNLQSRPLPQIPVFLFIMVVLGLCYFAWAFSSHSERGLLFSWGSWASYCGGSSCCREHRL